MEVYEFIVPVELERVLVYGYFTDEVTLTEYLEDPAKGEPVEVGRFWEATSVYDMTSGPSESRND